MPRPSIDPKIRFLSKVHYSDDGCWIWTGAYAGTTGYGTFWFNRGMISAHRFSHVAFIGPIPEGLVVDHVCGVPGCVNPDHLEAVTQKENIQRGDTALHERIKTHCPRNHAYDEANTHYNKKGWRQCRACARARTRTGARPQRKFP